VARVYTTSEGGPWMVSGWIDGVDLPHRETQLISQANLDATYKGVILDDLTKIAGDAVWRSVDEKLELPADGKEAARASMRMAMTAGSKLYRTFSQDDVFKHLLGLINNLPDGSKITMISNGTVFPWELFYPLDYIDGYPEGNYQPDKFWGARFLFESLLVTPSGEHKPPPMRRQSGRLHVSMGVNSAIDRDWEGRSLLPAALHKAYYTASLSDRGSYYDQHEDIAELLRTPHATSMIYFFCHGSSDELQFNKEKGALNAFHVMGESYPGYPIVFVNACSAGNISPLSFLSFRTEFRKKRAAGLIAPSFPVPTLFAAVFAKTFLIRYADGQPVGQILFMLRRELLLAKDNPLGLWYSLQCPLDVRAPKPER
jgi:hypothetical protein